MPQTYTIAIDANEANVAHRVGSNVYAFEIIRHLELLTRKNKHYQFEIFTAHPLKDDFPKSRTNWKYTQIGPAFLWTQWAAPLHLFWHKANYDLWYSPGHYAPKFCPIPYVSSVMDLGYEVFPEQFRTKDLFQLKYWTRASVAAATKVITISEFTRSELVRLYAVARDKIAVAPPAVSRLTSPSEKQTQQTLSTYLLNKPFFLYLGTLQPRKNVVKVIKAFEVLHQQLTLHPITKYGVTIKASDITLVLAGKIGWQAEEILQVARESPITKQIVLTGFVDEVTKYVLLKEAEALLLLGLYEGFGIPALEAMELKTIPIVSNLSSLPEVVGQAGMMVNPHDTAAIAAAMADVLRMSARTKGMWRKRSIEQSQKSSWEDSAKVVLEQIKTVVEKNTPKK